MDTDLRNKILYALNNAENLPRDRLQKVYREAVTFGEKLPPKERGAFFGAIIWKCYP